MTALRTLSLVLTLAAAPAMAQDAPAPADDPGLDAAGFDALTRGKTFDTHDAEVGPYGVETFLPGRRVIWRDSDGCMKGTWRQAGDQICFDYEDRATPVCWTYHDRGDWIEGFFDGQRQSVPIMLYPGADPVSCEGYVGV